MHTHQVVVEITGTDATEEKKVLEFFFYGQIASFCPRKGSQRDPMTILPAYT